MRITNYMKLCFAIAFILLLLSCNNPDEHKPINNTAAKIAANESNPELTDKAFNIDTAAVLKDFTSWYNYAYYNAPLSQDFIGLDTDSALIDKKPFLNNLIKGGVVAFKIKQINGQPVYKLYQLKDGNEKLSSQIKYFSQVEINHYEMEGKQILPFDFSDLKGIKYDLASTKGKIIVMKCWYIGCAACIKEFPECNALVDKYAGRNDILFLSIAFDKKDALKKFLEKRTFKYAVIPEGKDYIQDKLGVSIYPTHLLINKEGKIVKVVNSLNELKPFVEKEAEKKL